MIPRWKRNYLQYKSYLLGVVALYQKRKDIRAYLELLLSLATISIFAVFAIKPTLTTIAELTREIKIKEETITVMDNKIENLTKARSIYDTQMDNLSLLDKAVPEGPMPGDFSRQIEGASYANGVVIMSLSMGKASLTQAPEAVTADELTKYFPEVLEFTVNTTNNYQSLIQFVKSVGRLLRPVIITGVNFGRTGTEQGDTLLLVISAQTPYIKK